VLAVCLNDIPELQNNLSRPPAWLARLYRRSAVVRRAVDAEGREIASVEELFVEPEARRVRQGWERFFAEVRGLRDEVQAGGARLALLVFPFRFQVLPGAPAPLAQRRLAAFAHQEGLPLLDTLPALARLGEAAFFDYDHLSPAGAEEVAAQLLATGWIPAGYERRPLLDERAPPEALLASPDPARREAAAWELCSRGHAPVPTLVHLLESDPDRAVRAAAARALACAGARAAPGPEALLQALQDDSEVVRWAAARALAQLRPLLDVALPGLEAAVASGDPFVRSYAAFELSRFGPRARAALPALLEALAREPRAEWLARSVARLDPAGDAAVPRLVELLGPGTRGQRVNAALALGCLGGAAGSAQPSLLAALRDSDPALRAEAARALGRLGRPEPVVVEALAAALRDESANVRVMAARALGWLRANTAEATAALRRATGDESEKVAGEARAALEGQAGGELRGRGCQ
jgi:HEAT repeat protein